MQRYSCGARALVLACSLLFGCGGGGGGSSDTGTGSGGSTSSSGGSTGTTANASTPVVKAANLSSASVVADAAQNVSDTGGDDLAAARGLFRSASYPESNGGLQSSGSLLNSIGTTYSRTINAEDTSYLDGSGAFFPSNRIQWNLDWIQRYAYNAHVIVGQKQPGFIATPASQWSADQWSVYEDYATKFVRYVAVQYNNSGFAETLFEVGNEIDITQDVRDLWTMANPAVPQGDEGRYQHYMRVYPVWARAVARVASENPGRTIRIAGPALGGQSLFLTATFWHERFITDVATNHLRLDMVTQHFYGDVLNGWANVPGSNLRAQLQRIRRALVANGMASVPIAITEYGPSEGSDAVFGHINYSHESAAWAATFVREALAGTATAGSYLLVRDNSGASTTGSPTTPSLTHIRDGIDYPKPVLNAFRMFMMLPGVRKAVTLPAQQPNVQAFAAADAASAGLLAYNYNFRFNWPSDFTDLTVAETVAPGFVNLAFNGSVSVERYLIDRNTSNIARYLDAGSAPDYNGSMLTLAERCSATVSGGSLVLPPKVLSPSAVSLWLVRSGADAGLPACQ